MYDMKDLHQLKDLLSTPRVEVKVRVTYHLHLCARWDLADLNGKHMLSRNGICLVTFFRDRCVPE